MEIKILGENYTYTEEDPKEYDFNGSDGFCRVLDKEIFVKIKDAHAGISDKAKQERYEHVITHELVHAFMHESGRDYDEDELLTDWIATMIPKINKVLNQILNSDNK